MINLLGHQLAIWSLIALFLGCLLAVSMEALGLVYQRGLRWLWLSPVGAAILTYGIAAWIWRVPPPSLAQWGSAILFALALAGLYAASVAAGEFWVVFRYFARIFLISAFPIGVFWFALGIRDWMLAFVIVGLASVAAWATLLAALQLMNLPLGLCRLAMAIRAAGTKGSTPHQPQAHIYTTTLGRRMSGAGFESSEQGIERVSKGIAVMWNGGCQTLAASHVPNLKPIRFNVPGEILAVTVAAWAGEGISVRRTGSEVALTFVSLNPLDGVCVEIIHDGARPWPTLMETDRDSLELREPLGWQIKYLPVLVIPVTGGILEILEALRAAPVGPIAGALLEAIGVLVGVLLVFNWRLAQELEHYSEHAAKWVKGVPKGLQFGGEWWRLPTEPLEPIIGAYHYERCDIPADKTYQLDLGHERLVPAAE